VVVKKGLGLIALVACVTAFVIHFSSAQKPKQAEPSLILITSTSFDDGAPIPRKYTCDGMDISPQLSFSGIPPETRSLVLIVDDPDAPAGTWNHWLLWNIDPKTTEVREAETPEDSITGTNDFGKNRYNGPCPPSGVHRYLFKIFALDSKLDLKPAAKRVDLDRLMQGHILTQGTLMGKYTHEG
jgi:Raf kinase inhibitor-like YbhB/YbcL family protein